MKEALFRPLVAALLAMALPLRADSPLETAVLAAVRAAHFEHVIDFGAGNENHPVKAALGLPAPTIAHPPNVNVAVLQFDAAGNLVDRAYVLLSRDYPDGLVVPLDPDAGPASVHFLRWDIERSDGGTFSSADGHQLTTKGWTNNPPLTAADDLVPGRTHAPYQFMVPYPASLFKSMIAFHVMRLIDAGKLTLDTEYAYEADGAKPEPRKIRVWLDGMITVSDNHCTSALLKMFHDKGEIDPLNAEFRELNLPTLQINATDPKNGRGWNTAQINLTAYDIARMFRLIDGGPGVFWHDAHGRPVTEKILSDSSRAFPKKTLSDQAYNDCLTTINLTGVKNVHPGIPTRVSERWLNPTNGHVYIHDEDYGADVRTANTNAELNFAHKTGLTFNYGADAGIITPLPGKPFRHYIIAIIGNLGYRYADEVFAANKTFPGFAQVSPIAYTQRIPALGQAIDTAVTQLSAEKK
ncbi:MAG: serine hydrolase [Verrucomicrobiae bacterium]|nr:serine hydrolase [Verrucomicrobiae bacterium]